MIDLTDLIDASRVDEAVDRLDAWLDAYK